MGKMSLATILGIIFIVLKLCNVIAWSWIWVLSPFWIDLVLAIIIYIIAKILQKF
jgi:hypothetical protein